MNWTLQGKKALITGGSKGIGLATADELLALNAEVLIVARGEDALKGALETRPDQPLHGMVADVTTEEGRKAIVAKVSELWTGLDILVNNAGTNIRKTSLDYTSEEARFLFETNIFSVFELCRALFSCMVHTGNASIINVASVAGVFDVLSGSPYAMTKAAEIQLSRNLAVEWAKYGIRVNAVSPWYTETPLTTAVLSNEEKLDAIVSRTPLGRVAQAEEVAAVIAFLAMDKASYLTGQNLLVDGGMSIKGL
jgi:NAD(P)-dependent dehydrogenase (short-subunit alcohol dehydrogenase family)